MNEFVEYFIYYCVLWIWMSRSEHRLSVFVKFVTSEPFFFFPHPRIYRFKLWKTVLSPTLQSEKWYRLKISLEPWELGGWAAFTNSWITTIWEPLILNEVLENGKANSLVIFLEEFLSSLWGPDRTPAIPRIPRLCITRIKYHILNEARWDTQVLLMDECAEMVGIECLSTIVKLVLGGLASSYWKHEKPRT